MKEIILFISLIGLISCGRSKEQIKKDLESVKQKSHFKEGDIVYLKPDSTKAVITEISVEYDNCYCNVIGTNYKIRTSKGQEIVKENLFYNKPEYSLDSGY